MRCYSHLSDDQKRTDWSGQSFRPIRSARSPERSAVRSRPSGANSAATVCRAGATRHFTPPEPINCACGVKRRSKEIEPYGPSLSTGSRKGGPPSKFQAGSRAETNLVCGPWVARRSTPVRRRDERVGVRVTSGAARRAATRRAMLDIRSSSTNAGRSAVRAGPPRCRPSCGGFVPTAETTPPPMRRVPSPSSRSSIGAFSHSLISRGTCRSKMRRATDFRSSSFGSNRSNGTSRRRPRRCNPGKHAGALP
jgi:hypothetical protein